MFLKGPNGSIYEDRWLKILLTIDGNGKEIVKFKTKMHHPNVKKKTGLAQKLNLKKHITLVDKLAEIRRIIAEPDILRLADKYVGEQYINNREEFKAMALIIAEMQAPKNLEDLGWIDDKVLAKFEQQNEDEEEEKKEEEDDDDDSDDD